MAATKVMPTQARLKELFSYSGETGKFTRKVRVSQNTKVGDDPGYHDDGYIRICVDGLYWYAHVLVWIYVRGSPPDGMLDHKDRDRSNNRIENLRLANRAQNKANSAKRKDNTTGFIGVAKRDNRWVGAVYVKNGTKRSVIRTKSFDNPEDAARARDELAKKMFGEFSVTNF